MAEPRKRAPKLPQVIRDAQAAAGTNDFPIKYAAARDYVKTLDDALTTAVRSDADKTAEVARTAAADGGF